MAPRTLTILSLAAAVTLSGCTPVEPISAAGACRLWDSVWTTDDFYDVREPLRDRTKLSLQTIADDWEAAGSEARELAARVEADDAELAENMRQFADVADDAADGARTLAEDREDQDRRDEAADRRRALETGATIVTVQCEIERLDNY